MVCINGLVLHQIIQIKTTSNLAGVLLSKVSSIHLCQSCRDKNRISIQ